jgi:hypothetical protein
MLSVFFCLVATLRATILSNRTREMLRYRKYFLQVIPQKAYPLLLIMYPSGDLKRH